MDLFTIEVKAGTELYRGINDKNNEKGYWYTYDTKSAGFYGTKICKYILKKDIKVINIMSRIFQLHYIDNLNLMYRGDLNDGKDINKLKALIPLALPSKKLLEYFTGQKYLDFTNILEEVYSDCFSDTFRYSDYDIDKNFSEIIRKIYGDKCDGFTNLFNFPSRIQNGIFHPELCIFNIDYIEKVDEINIPKLSGGEISNTNNEPEVIRVTDEERERLHKRFAEIEKYHEELMSKTKKLPTIIRDTGPEEPLAEEARVDNSNIVNKRKIRRNTRRKNLNF